MLKKLELIGFALAPEIILEPIAVRYNLLVGDNGLGKSFILDTAWWVLTGTWSSQPLAPKDFEQAQIGYEFDTEQGKKVDKGARWDRKKGTWKRNTGRPPNPGLVIYARVDGSFSVWDPQRNYALITNRMGTTEQFPAAFDFRPEEVEFGLKDQGGERILCRGLVADFESWMLQKSIEYQLLQNLMANLGPDDTQIEFEGLDYTLPDDARPFPTIKLPYGAVSLLHLPAGMRRIVRLGYLLAWVLSGHRRECQRNGSLVARQITILFDEPETHLHPRWQRTLLPKLHKALVGWEGTAETAVQLLVATHSPLILASMEPHFDNTKDALWKMDLVAGMVKLERDHWYRRGEVGAWLTSDVFDLESARSKEAEQAIAAAKALIRSQSADKTALEAVTEALKKSLSDIDRFWMRWADYAEAHGVKT